MKDETGERWREKYYDKVEELNKAEATIESLRNLLKMSQENEGFCMISRDKFKNATLIGDGIIEHAVEAINEVQSKLAHLTGGTSAFSGTIKEAWNINAEFLQMVPEWQDQYLAKVAAEHECAAQNQRELMT